MFLLLTISLKNSTSKKWISRLNLKRLGLKLKRETRNLELKWKAIGHIIWVSQPKTEMLVGGLHDSSSKTNRTCRIKVSNLKARGQAVSAPKNKLWYFRPLFFFFYETTVTLRVGSIYVFLRAKLRTRQPEVEKAKALKRLKVETWNLEFG